MGRLERDIGNEPGLLERQGEHIVIPHVFTDGLNLEEIPDLGVFLLIDSNLSMNDFNHSMELINLHKEGFIEKWVKSILEREEVFPIIYTSSNREELGFYAWNYYDIGKPFQIDGEEISFPEQDVIRNKFPDKEISGIIYLSGKPDITTVSNEVFERYAALIISEKFPDLGPMEEHPALQIPGLILDVFFLHLNLSVQEYGWEFFIQQLNSSCSLEDSKTFNYVDEDDQSLGLSGNTALKDRKLQELFSTLLKEKISAVSGVGINDIPVDIVFIEYEVVTRGGEIENIPMPYFTLTE